MRLNLPRFRLALLRLERPPRISGRMLLYTLYTLVLFLLFLVANFPHHVLVRRALESVNLGPVHLDVRTTRFAWWKGYELRGVTLTQADVGLDALPLLESPKLFVRPAVGGLLRGKLSSVTVNGGIYGGAVYGRWAIEEGGARTTVRFDSLQLGYHPLLAQLLDEGQMAARLSGVLSFEPRGTGIAGGEAAGDLTITDGSLTGAKVHGFDIPDLQSCTGATKVDLSGERLDIKEFRLDCNELKLAVSGQVTTRARLADSRLNLRLEPDLGPAATEKWKAVVPWIPCWISGTAARPRTQMCSVGSQVQRSKR